MKSQFKTRCVDIGCKKIQRVLMKLRGGTVELRVETGRWTDYGGWRGSASSVQVGRWRTRRTLFCIVRPHQRRGGSH